MKITKYALAALGLVALASPRTARADETYLFSVSTTSVNLGNSVEPFSFSFTVPTFVASDDTPAFTPFTLTDGTHSWTMVTDTACNAGSVGGFVFATATNAGLGSGCGFFVAPPDGGLLFLTLTGFLPTADGVYNLDPGRSPGVLFFGNIQGNEDNPSFGGTLTVTSTVPEPASFLLLGTGLLSLMGMALRMKWLA